MTRTLDIVGVVGVRDRMIYLAGVNCLFAHHRRYKIITPGLSNRRIIETRIAMTNRRNLIA